jgi:hypothetical protein
MIIKNRDGIDIYDTKKDVFLLDNMSPEERDYFYFLMSYGMDIRDLVYPGVNKYVVDTISHILNYNYKLYDKDLIYNIIHMKGISREGIGGTILKVYQIYALYALGFNIFNGEHHIENIPLNAYMYVLRLKLCTGRFYKKEFFACADRESDAVKRLKDICEKKSKCKFSLMNLWSGLGLLLYKFDEFLMIDLDHGPYYKSMQYKFAQKVVNNIEVADADNPLPIHYYIDL